MTEIIRADRSHITELSHLFNSYRVFYEQPSDIEKAGKFIESRINNDESTISKKQDTWTFQKKINSNSPIWLLSST